MGLVLRQGPDGAKFLYVAAVPEGTPAAKAGFAAGDVITAIDRVYAVDADGAGPGSPQIMVRCEYKCQVEHCNWV